jgi:DNA repair exonuclease SbcCD nuclease subunit
LLPSFKAVQKLAETGKPIYWIIGNHDLPFLEKRSPHSLPFLEAFSNITIIDEPTLIDDTLFVPWIVPSDNIKDIVSIKARYVFGHFEFPGFMMNQNYAMEAHEGMLSHEDFSGPEYIFSGHYHGRQIKKIRDTEVHYIGNAFPHNFSDANDTDRGMMIIEHGGKPVYKNWPNMPTYHKLNLSQYEGQVFGPRAKIIIQDDVGMSSEQRDDIRDMMLEGASTMGINIIDSPSILKRDDAALLLDGEDMMDMVTRRLKETDDPNYDADLLVDIFLKAETF